MASELGRTIREARVRAGVGLRELARRIEKSPSYVVALECAEVPPGFTEGTLGAIAEQVGLSMDVLTPLMSKVPSSLRPRTLVEVELYRLVRAMSPERQEELLTELKSDVAPEFSSS